MPSSLPSTTTLTRLKKRVEHLERLLNEQSSSSFSQSHAMRKLREDVSQSRLRQQKDARSVLKRTFGLMSKKRTDEFLKHIEESRNAWR